MTELTRKKIKAACLSFLEDRIALLRSELDRLREDMNGESKSTAGDKHETARAMAQIEQENIAGQLNGLLAQQENILKLQEEDPGGIAGPGAVVHTNRGIFYLASALGKIRAGKADVHVVSAASPVGRMLAGKKAGERFAMNNVEYRIERVA